MSPAAVSKITNFGVDSLIYHGPRDINHLLLAQLNFSGILALVLIVFLEVLWVDLSALQLLFPFLKFLAHHDVLLNLVAKVPLQIKNIRKLFRLLGLVVLVLVKSVV